MTAATVKLLITAEVAGKRFDLGTFYDKILSITCIIAEWGLILNKHAKTCFILKHPYH